MHEFITEWQHKYIQADDLKALCKEIDALDLQLHSKTDQQEYSQSASQVVQKIKSTSRQFLVQVSSQVDVLESFFLEQVKNIGKKSDEIEGLAKKAIQIKLEPTKCGALVDKMKDVLGKISVLQNFTIYNYDQLQVLCRLHDSSSQEAYNSIKWLEEKMDQTTFDDNDKYEVMQNKVIKHYAAWLNIPEKKAQIELLNSEKGENNLDAREGKTAAASFFAGVSAVLVASFINLMVYCYKSPFGFELTKLQQISTRVNFVVATMIVGMGAVISVFHKRKLNFAFMCQIPSELLVYGHRNVLKVGFIQLSIVTAAAILLSVGQVQLVEPVPILFGQFVVRVSRIMKPTYWMLFPTVSLPLFSIYNVLKSKGQKCVFTYCMNILFKMFTPWRQRIEFPHFYFCSLLGSAAGSFKDIIQIICVNRLPDYIGILFQNIFSANRLVQSYIKYRESKRFYNQGLGIINNSIGIISTISGISALRPIEPAFWTFVGLKAFNYLVKTYWNTCENWALLWGGVSVIKFKNKPEKWSYGKYLRRPTHLPLHVIIPIALYDPIARGTWIFALIPSCQHFASQFWFKMLTLQMSVLRVYLWMILRLDNQQCSNCEDYSVTKFIPVVIDDYERDKMKDSEKQKQDQEAMAGIQDLQSIFNNGSGKAKILNVNQTFRRISLQHITAAEFLARTQTMRSEFKRHSRPASKLASFTQFTNFSQNPDKQLKPIKSRLSSKLEHIELISNQFMNDTVETPTFMGNHTSNTKPIQQFAQFSHFSHSNVDAKQKSRVSSQLEPNLHQNSTIEILGTSNEHANNIQQQTQKSRVNSKLEQKQMNEPLLGSNANTLLDDLKEQNAKLKIDIEVQNYTDVSGMRLQNGKIEGEKVIKRGGTMDFGFE
ncbi:EXS_family protein [Hexamita inflata]|uniref:EXS_family protein n=1 Tax=Hexamita inflata TaxID=28002 RepID=A0ABP1KGZ9_9EUKA